MTYTREELVYRAKLLEQAERYDDVAQEMKKVVELDGNLDEEERRLLSIAYHKIVNEHRFAMRAISKRTNTALSETQQQIVKEMLSKEERDMEEKSREALELLDKHLIPQAADDDQLKVFYLTMKADFFRHLAEMTKVPDAADQSYKTYKEAFDIAKDKIRPSHPIRLGVALNFAVGLYNVINLPDEALNMAKQAYDDADADLLTNTCDDAYQESISLMEKLQENQTLWAMRKAPIQAKKRGSRDANDD